jgi:hypothetical protein
LTSLNLPLLENFNDRKRTIHCLEQVQQELLDTNWSVNLDGVKMSGAAGAGSPLWVASTSTTAFTNNPNYIKDYLSVN